MQEQFVGTMPVVDRNKFGYKALNFMEKNVQDFSGDLTVEQFKGGQSNPTYRISTNKENTSCVGNRRASYCPRPMLLTANSRSFRRYKILRCLYQNHIVCARMNLLSVLCSI